MQTIFNDSEEQLLEVQPAAELQDPATGWWSRWRIRRQRHRQGCSEIGEWDGLLDALNEFFSASDGSGCESDDGGGDGGGCDGGGGE